MNKKIVIALGGNALGKTAEEQLRLVRQTAKPISDFVCAGDQVILAHGNGPQVGMINLAFASAEKAGETAGMPFPECGAMSQGYIGYHLQQAIGDELRSRNVKKNIAAVVTQVLVDENDPGFQNPTKPIGAFYSKEEAQRIAAATGHIFKDDAGRGYRRVIASPRPTGIIEKETISLLIESGHIVIAAGGGGVPVCMKGGRLTGVPAVIDKDFASSKLAQLTGADLLIILTAVEKVSINFGSPDQQDIDEITATEAKALAAEGHFAAGSMLPKIQAGVEFVESAPGRIAYIAGLETCFVDGGIRGTKIKA